MSAGSWTEVGEDSQSLTKLEQMVCYLNLHLFGFLQIFQISGIGPRLLPQIYFCPYSFLQLPRTFLMFILVSFLILWITCVPPIFNIYYPNACIETKHAVKSIKSLVDLVQLLKLS